MSKKQGELPGMERPSHPDVDAAAEKFHTHRKKHAKSGQQLRDLKLKVVDEMRKVKLDEYRDDDVDPPLIIRLDEDFKVSVKELKHEKPPKKEAANGAAEEARA